MKILVLSDSHSHKRFMERCMETVKPDAVIHLGDYSIDALDIRIRNSVPLYQLPGNCDGYSHTWQEAVCVSDIGGVKFFMTHGHLHSVKNDISNLLRDARREKVDIVLYGHTHRADLHQEEDGLWVMNPGTASFFMSSAGLIEVEDGIIKDIRLLRDEDLKA